MLPVVVGLTGLMGSGKSLVAECFRQLGVSIIDTDVIAHTITKNGGVAIPFIKDTFGDEFIVAQALDRSKMRNLIFSNPNAKDLLEGILHPLILVEVKQQLKEITNSIYVIVVVPLLFKVPRYMELVERTIFVDCEEDILIKRVIDRSGLNSATIKTMLKAQIEREQQLNLADDILDNNKSKEDLEQQIKLLHAKYLNLKHEVMWQAP
jgi:dephospho-CoA kinase